MAVRPLFFLAAIFSVGLTLSACAPQRPQRAACPAHERCLEYGNGADPVSLNPQIATAVNEAAILRELFEGMYADGPDGAPVPGVLLGEPQVSPDGLTWTFHMRPEKWSDGVPLTANDFVFAYRHMLDPKTGSSYAYLLYVLKNGQPLNAGKAAPETLGVRALDDETLQLTLEHPASFLPQLLKHQAFYPIPEHVVQRLGEAWSKPGNMVGNGAYVLTAWKLGDYVRIDRNPLYHDAAKVCFDRVNYYPIGDPISAERRTLRDELDVSNTIQSNRVARLRADKQWAPYVHAHPYLSLTYMIFNRRDVKPLQDVRVRQAISMAVDRSFITDKLLRAGQVPTTSFVPAGIAGYLPASAPHPKPYWGNWPLEQRQAEARRLLAAAGFGPDHPLSLELKTFNSPISLLVMESVQSDLKTVGVSVHMRQEEGIVALQSFEIRDFQLGDVGWIADYNDPMTYLTLMKSDTGAQNYGDYKNAAYDALLDKADNEPNAATRTQYLARAEQMVLDDADVIPLLVGDNLNLVNPHITGWVDNDSDIHPIRYLCRNDAPAGASNRAP
jgi:oligopeptide transport system substrate-binding protein